MKVISFIICPFVQRVTARLEATSTPYDIDYIELSNKPDWFLAISPNGQVPVLITDNSTPLFESEAIVEYLDDIGSPIERDVTPEQKALDRAWSIMAAKHYLTQCSTMRSGDESTFRERLSELQELFKKAEKVIEGPFFKGISLSNVDITWLPLLHRAHIINTHTGVDFLEGFPKVQKWQQAIIATDLPGHTVPQHFERAFTDFYLSPKTWLGCQVHCADDSENCNTTTCC